MTKTAIYAGSFDPITNGHLDVLERALKLFDKIIIAVGDNPQKKYLFSVDERMSLISEATNGKKNIEVDSFSGLLVEFARKKKAVAIIRGLRAVSDYESELQMALMNRKLDQSIETVFLMARGMYCYLSASVVKEAAQLGANLSGMVPLFVEQKLKKKFNTKG